MALNLSGSRVLQGLKLTTKLKWYRILGRLKALPKEVKFAGKHAHPRNLLFFFPLTRKPFEESIHVLRRLEKHPARNNFQFAISYLYKDHIPKPSHPTFFFPMDAKEEGRADLAILEQRYGGKRFDAVINLAPEVDLHMARIISTVVAPKRIGLEAPGSDEVYNIQIRSGGEGSLSSAYDQILDLCDLGPVNDHPDYTRWG